MRKILIYTIPVIGMLVIPFNAFADGQELYNKHCKKCHGETGKGDTAMGKKLKAKDYSSAEVQATMTDETIIKSIKEGLKDEKGKLVMMSFGSKLSDDETKAIVAYVRSLKQD